MTINKFFMSSVLFFQKLFVVAEFVLLTNTVSMVIGGRKQFPHRK